MDLQVAIIILIVFLVSFMSYLFISKFLPHGKTFDEMIAEKKRMREEMLGTMKPTTIKTFKVIPGNKKKPKKKVTTQKSESQKSNQSESEEDIEMIEQQILQEAQKAVANKRKVNKKKTSPKEKTSESEEQEEVLERKVVTVVATVVEEQTPQPATISPEPAKSKNQQAKKKIGKGGILTNKNEPVLVKEVDAVEAVNHFETIHPKDAVEIQRSTQHEEKNSKNFRDSKKTKKQTPPVSPRNQKKAEDVVVKKKRSVETATERVSFVDGVITDESEITPMLRELNRADLTKNQIQVLIDFLLNKQSDTTARDPAEWTEGKSDLLQKLKKQLQEKEAQLKNEQDALSGMQIKLKDLRVEFNAEKSQFNASLKAHVEQMNNCKSEIKSLQSELQLQSEKHNNEKQSMSVSFKQLQQKLMQMSESLKAYESLPNIQQIQADNQVLQNEIISKNQQIVELKAFADESRQMDDAYKQKLAEYESKIAEMDVHLRKNNESSIVQDNEMRQRVQDLSNRDSEIQKLNNDIVHVKDILQRQAVEKDQISQQLHTLQNNDETKIEIKNLQNALDSSKKELEAQRMLVNEYKIKIEDLGKQVTESKLLTQKTGGDSFLLNEKLNEMAMNHQNIISEKDKQLVEFKKQIESLQKTESELSKLIEEQKAKNNDLRMKNWKLVEALQSAQTSSTTSQKITTNHSNSVVHANGIDVKTVKDLIVEHFPDYASFTVASSDDDETKWLKSVLENLKTQLVSNNQSNHNNSTSPSANHLNKNNSTNNNNNNNNFHEVEKNNSTNALNGDTNSTLSSSASSMDNELILIQNAQLRTSVDEYKNIIAETESMLKNLESKVREQDAYWTKVVLMKDNEITNLKGHGEQS